MNRILFNSFFLLNVIYVGICFGGNALDGVDQVSGRAIKTNSTVIKSPSTKTYLPLKVNASREKSLNFEPLGSTGGSPSTLNLLNFDELWISYHSVENSQACDYSGRLQTLALDVDSEKGNAKQERRIFLSSGGVKTPSNDVFLNNKVLPRTFDYLIRRQLGMQDSSWRIVEEGRKKIYMHTMRIDLQAVSSIKFAIANDFDRVNFRLSHKHSGIPTDILVWDEIPKMEFLQNGVHYVQMDLAGAIKKKWPEILDGSGPLNLTEIIVFSRDDAISIDVAPINRINSYFNYDLKFPFEKLDVRSLSRTEDLGGGQWLWRMQLLPLEILSLKKNLFIRGDIFSTQLACIKNIDSATLVVLPPQEIKFNEEYPNRGITGIKKNAKVDSGVDWHNLVLIVLLAFSIIIFLANKFAIDHPALFAFKKIFDSFHENLEVSMRRLHVFFFVNRQKLNFGLFIAALIFAIYATVDSSLKYYISEQGLFSLFILGAFVALHALRWRLSALGGVTPGSTVRLIIGNNDSPPLIIWFLSALTIFIMMLMQWVIDSSTTDKQQILFGLSVSNIVEKFQILILWCTLNLAERGPNLSVMLAIFYGFLPWMWRYFCINLFPKSVFFLSSVGSGISAWRWALISLIFYICGFFSIGRSGENLFFSFGALAVLASLSGLVCSSKIYFKKNWPLFDFEKYNSGGLIYFIFAFAGIVLVQLLTILQFVLILDNVATIVFFCLIAGATMEILSWNRNISNDGRNN